MHLVRSASDCRKIAIALTDPSPVPLVRSHRPSTVPASLRAQIAITLREHRSAAGSPCVRDALPCAMQILLSG